MNSRPSHSIFSIISKWKINVHINYFQNFDIVKLELLDFFLQKINYFNSNLQIISVDMVLCMHWHTTRKKVFKYYTNRIEDCLPHFPKNPLTLLFSQWNFFVLVFFFFPLKNFLFLCFASTLCLLMSNCQKTIKNSRFHMVTNKYMAQLHESKE